MKEVGFEFGMKGSVGTARGGDVERPDTKMKTYLGDCGKPLGSSMYNLPLHSQLCSQLY